MNAIYILDLIRTSLLESCKIKGLGSSPTENMFRTLIHLGVSSVWVSADKSWHYNSSVDESL